MLPLLLKFLALDLFLSVDSAIFIAVTLDEAEQRTHWRILCISCLITIPLRLGLTLAIGQLLGNPGFGIGAAGVITGLSLQSLRGKSRRSNDQRQLPAGRAILFIVVGFLATSADNLLTILANGGAEQRGLALIAMSLSCAVVFAGARWLAKGVAKVPLLREASIIFVCWASIPALFHKDPLMLQPWNTFWVKMGILYFFPVCITILVAFLLIRKLVRQQKRKENS